MKKQFITLLVLLMISFVLAVPDCPLDGPKSYSGTVSYDKKLLEGNYEINAMIGNSFAGTGRVINGEYEIDISPCSGITGIVDFYINSIKADEQGSYVGMDDWGKNENLDLIINELPPFENLCGNEIKNPGEVCDRKDFGVYTCSNYGFNSGYLVCSNSCDWIYTNNCYDKNDNAGSKDSSSSNPSSNSIIKTETNTNIKIENTNDTDNNKENNIIGLDFEKTSSGITGGVIDFVKSGTGIGLIFILLILGIGMMILKKRAQKNE